MRKLDGKVFVDRLPDGRKVVGIRSATGEEISIELTPETEQELLAELTGDASQTETRTGRRVLK